MLTCAGQNKVAAGVPGKVTATNGAGNCGAGLLFCAGINQCYPQGGYSCINGVDFNSQTLPYYPTHISETARICHAQCTGPMTCLAWNYLSLLRCARAVIEAAGYGLYEYKRSQRRSDENLTPELSITQASVSMQQ